MKGERLDGTNITCKRIFLNLSWASLILKERSRLEQISRLWSFLTLFTNPSLRGRFLATTRRPLPGRGLTDILFPSIISQTLQITHHFGASPPNSNRKNQFFFFLIRLKPRAFEYERKARPPPKSLLQMMSEDSEPPK